MKKRVADIIMDTLVEYGITDCFAVVGAERCTWIMHCWYAKR